MKMKNKGYFVKVWVLEIYRRKRNNIIILVYKIKRNIGNIKCL